MENTSKSHDRENPSPSNSRIKNGNINCMSSSCNSNGVQVRTPSLTPRILPRSDLNPYPTTFVQADTYTFKQVVQMLTGSEETAKQASKPVQDSLPASRNYGTTTIKAALKKQGFKLYERRPNLKNNLMINTLVPNSAHRNSGFSPRQSEILSPSLLDFPSLTLSPVTPLNDDPFNKSSPSLGSSSSEEEKAIAEKGFYLFPSPISTPRESQPQLLPLFPLTSPKLSGPSS